MLVGAFQIEVGDPVRRAIRPVAQHEGMGGAASRTTRPARRRPVHSPTDHDACQHLFLESLHIPDIRALRLERGDDAGVHRRVAQQEVGIGRLRALLHEAGQRHAPGALARQHPVGPRLDHRMQAVAPGLRRPLHQLVDAESAPARGSCRHRCPCRRPAACRWRRTIAACCDRSAGPSTARNAGRSASASPWQTARRNRPAA